MNTLNIKPSKLSTPQGTKKEKNRLFSPFFNMYFFRTCTQTGVTLQKNGFIKNGFSGHAENFLHFGETGHISFFHGASLYTKDNIIN